jgi:putative transposase
MVEEMSAARGIEVTYETLRSCALMFGQDAARRIRAKAAVFGDKWHLDEVAISINGKKRWLWRAVDRFGIVLDVLVLSLRDRYAAQRLMRKLLRKYGVSPRVLVTDMLKSYAAANKDMQR